MNVFADEAVGEQIQASREDAATNFSSMATGLWMFSPVTFNHREQFPGSSAFSVLNLIKSRHNFTATF